MKKVRIRRWGGKFGFMKNGRRNNYESASDDEELLYGSTNNQYTNTLEDPPLADGQIKPKWRPIPLFKEIPLIPCTEGLDEEKTHAVFPGGVYLHIASNPNPCDILLTFRMGAISTCGDPSFVIPPQGAIYNHAIVEPPSKNGPRSEKWCDTFGIITAENLRKGVVRQLPDKRLVVWRKFRHRPDLDTPFSLYYSRSQHNKSEASYMIYTEKDFDHLLRDSCGVQCSALRIYAEPILDTISNEGLKPIHVHVSCPAVISEEYLDEVVQDSDSYHTASANIPPVNHSQESEQLELENQYQVQLEETDFLETLAINSLHVDESNTKSESSL